MTRDRAGSARWRPAYAGIGAVSARSTGFAPDLMALKAAYLKAVDEAYVSDAYHSLSIEGYRVSAALIEKGRQRNWNPDDDQDGLEQRNAWAARGYFDAFQSVKDIRNKVLSGENAGDVVDEAHGDWYRQLLGPSVAAGIVDAVDLAGYRNGPVYIRRSMHVPSPRDAVRDCMPALKSASVDQNIVPFAQFLAGLVQYRLDGKASPAVPAS